MVFIKAEEYVGQNMGKEYFMGLNNTACVIGKSGKSMAQKQPCCNWAHASTDVFLMPYFHVLAVTKGSRGY